MNEDTIKASDTVMSPEQLRAINDDMPPTAKYGEVFKEIAKVQAEITGKIMLNQGRKDVVEWIYDHSLVISKGQCWTHGEGRFIPENNIQALKGLE